MFDMSSLPRKLLLIFWYLNFTATCAATINLPGASANPKGLNASTFLDGYRDNTRLGAINPLAFETRCYFGSINLPTHSILVDALDAMVELALLDWEGHMGPKTFRSPIVHYAQIEISISPADRSPGATMHPAYAVLGLFDLVLEILSDPRRRSRSAESEFLYNGHFVGKLILRRSVASPSSEFTSEALLSPYPTLLSAKPNVSHDSAIAGDASTDVLSYPAWADPRLKVSMLQGNDRLTTSEIFFAVLEMLVKCAPHPSFYLVQDFDVVIDTPPITTAHRPIFATFAGLRGRFSTPPYFQWEWLVKSLGQLPIFMLEKRDFRDAIRVGVRVDGIRVGEGQIVRQSRGLESL